MAKNNTPTDHIPVATVKSVEGEVYAIAPNGERRLLKEGDKIYLHEKVHTTEGASLVILDTAGTEHTVDADQQFDVMPSQPDGDDDITKIQNALIQGIDPSVLEATASGGQPTGGANFVTVDPIRLIGKATSFYPTGPFDILFGQELEEVSPILSDEEVTFGKMIFSHERMGIQEGTDDIDPNNLPDRIQDIIQFLEQQEGNNLIVCNVAYGPGAMIDEIVIPVELKPVIAGTDSGLTSGGDPIKLVSFDGDLGPGVFVNVLGFNMMTQEIVFLISSDGTSIYFIQFAAVDHPLPGEDIVFLDIGINAINGIEIVMGSVQIKIIDDIPDAGPDLPDAGDEALMLFEKAIPMMQDHENGHDLMLPMVQNGENGGYPPPMMMSNQLHGTLHFDGGKDGGRITDILFMGAVDPDGPAPNPVDIGLPDLYSMGEKVEFELTEVDDMLIYTGTINDGATKVIEIKIIQAEGSDPNEAEYWIRLLKAIDHPDKNEFGDDDILELMFKYTVTDGDNDTDQAVITIQVKDDAPEAHNTRIMLKEDKHHGEVYAVAHGYLDIDPSADNPNLVTRLRFLRAVDRDDGGLIDLQSGGEDVIFGQSFMQNGNLIIEGKIDGTDDTIVRIIIDKDTGEFWVKLLGALDHPDHGEIGRHDQITLVFRYMVTDGDRDMDTALLRVHIKDDGPDAKRTMTMVQESKNDEGEVYVTAHGQLNVDPSADMPNTVTGLWFYDVLDGDDEPNPDDPFTFRSCGDKISFGDAFMEDGQWVIEGRTEMGDELIVRVSIDKETGEFWVKLLGPIDHPDIDETGAEDPIDILFKYRVTDGDWDSDMAILRVRIKDDGPMASDERADMIDECGNSHGTLDFKTGADMPMGRGAQAITNIEFLGAMDKDSGEGVRLTSWGKPVRFGEPQMEDGEIVLYGKIAMGEQIMTVIEVRIDKLTGEYWLKILKPLDHFDPTESGIDDALILKFEYTVTDKDGDSVTAKLGVLVKDSAPEANDVMGTVEEGGRIPDPPQRIAQGKEACGFLMQDVDFDFGKDTHDASIMFKDPGDLNLTVDGEPVEVQSYLNDTILGGRADGELVFILVLDPEAKSFKFWQFEKFDQQDDPEDPTVALNFGYKVTDGDADMAMATITINAKAEPQIPDIIFEDVCVYEDGEMAVADQKGAGPLTTKLGITVNSVDPITKIFLENVPSDVTIVGWDYDMMTDTWSSMDPTVLMTLNNGEMLMIQVELPLHSDGDMALDVSIEITYGNGSSVIYSADETLDVIVDAVADPGMFMGVTPNGAAEQIAYSIGGAEKPSGHDSTLYKIDLSDGSIMDIGIVKVTLPDMSMHDNLDVEAMAFNASDGCLYAVVDVTGQAKGLIKVNPADASTTWIGGDIADVISGALGGMTIFGNTAYFTAPEMGSSILYSVDLTTGDIIDTFGDTDVDLGAIAANPITGLLIGIGEFMNSTNLYEIDPSDGSTTLIGSLFTQEPMEDPEPVPPSSQFEGLSFDASGNLYALERKEGELFNVKVDPITGEITLIGTTLPNSQQTGNGFENLAISSKFTIHTDESGEVSFSIKVAFDDLDGSEEHFLLVELPAGFSDPDSYDTIEIMGIAGADNGTYLKIPVELMDLINGGGMTTIDVTLDAPANPGMYSISVIARTEEQADESEDGEKTNENNIAHTVLSSPICVVVDEDITFGKMLFTHEREGVQDTFIDPNTQEEKDTHDIAPDDLPDNVFDILAALEARVNMELPICNAACGEVAMSTTGIAEVTLKTVEPGTDSGLTSGGDPIKLSTFEVNGVVSIVGFNMTTLEPIFLITTVDKNVYFLQFAEVDHPGEGEDIVILDDIGINVLTESGQSQMGSFQLKIIDDIPTAEDTMKATVEEDDDIPMPPTRTGGKEACGYTSGDLNFDFGKDQDGNIMLKIPEDFNFTVNGSEVSFNLINPTTLLGLADGGLVFILQIDPMTKTFEFWQFEKFDTPVDPHDPFLDLAFGYKVTDGDNDMAMAAILIEAKADEFETVIFPQDECVYEDGEMAVVDQKGAGPLMLTLSFTTNAIDPITKVFVANVPADVMLLGDWSDLGGGVWSTTDQTIVDTLMFDVKLPLHSDEDLHLALGIEITLPDESTQLIRATETLDVIVDAVADPGMFMGLTSEDGANVAYAIGGKEHQGGHESILYKIDLSTGNTMPVYTVKVNPPGKPDAAQDNLDVEAMAFNAKDGCLYAVVNVNGNSKGLIKLDPNDPNPMPEATWIGGVTFNNMSQVSGLAGMTIVGMMAYFATQDGGSSDLYSMNLMDGSLSIVGDTKIDIGGLAADPVTGELFAIGRLNETLYKLDPAGASMGMVPSVALSPALDQDPDVEEQTQFESLSFDAQGRLWTIDRLSGELYEIKVNPFDGTVDLIGTTISTSDQTGDGFENLAISPKLTINIPEEEDLSFDVKVSFADLDGSEAHFLLVELPVGFEDPNMYETVVINAGSGVPGAGADDYGTYIKIPVNLMELQNNNGMTEINVTLTAPEDAGSYNLSLITLTEETPSDEEKTEDNNTAYTLMSPPICVIVGEENPEALALFNDQGSDQHYDTYILGSNDDDTIRGSDNPDHIDPGEGDDVVVGAGGNDFIDAGNGNDGEADAIIYESILDGHDIIEGFNNNNNPDLPHDQVDISQVFDTLGVVDDAAIRASMVSLTKNADNNVVLSIEGHTDFSITFVSPAANSVGAFDVGDGSESGTDDIIVA